MLSETVLIVADLGVIGWAVARLTQRREVERARRLGLYPSVSRTPTLQDVQRLANAGEKILAIKLYREIHRVDLKTAKEAVERLVQAGGPANRSQPDGAMGNETSGAAGSGG